ncbi:unnamed protein product [Durusdinium trenchii]|uniref:Periodic tryptophan protein 1 n=1 Tax=Durusdinium trenchii TaxID=1381693 RepID=A0ABP0I024_9DINO
MEKTAVTCVAWLPRGVCSGRLTALEEEEDEQMREGAAAVAAQVAKGSVPGLEEFDMENYDEDEDEGHHRSQGLRSTLTRPCKTPAGMQFFSVLDADGALARERDPHLTGNPDSDSDSEGEVEIRAEDHVFVAASCEEDCCTLELYVFEEEEVNMYVHHDISLGAYPLCVEWMARSSAGVEGCFAAVGSIDHSIQLWNLEEPDPLEPVQVLGSARKAKGAKNKAKKKKKPPGSSDVKAHEGPVLCLHGNSFNTAVLASGSADRTLKVWDVGEGSCVHTFDHHSDKVQCVKWHPTEQAVLLSSAFDGQLGLLDVRQPKQAALAALNGEAESAIWSRHNPYQCYASTDNGAVRCYDVRKVANKADNPVLWTLMAHDVACTSLQDAPAKNLLVTAGLDGHAKVWNLASSPQMVLSKNLQAGPIFTCQSNADMPGLMCFGGKCPVMWDLSSEQVLLDAFKLDTA